MKGFRAFLLRGNVVDLAVGIVIGAAFTTVVDKLVTDFVSPFIALLGGESDFSRFYFSIAGKKFLYGDFINGLIAFMLSATVLYFLVVRPYGYLLDHFHHGPPPDRKKQCPECLSQIPQGARKCAYCASEQPSSILPPLAGGGEVGG